jgi:hypothetical protein
VAILKTALRGHGGQRAVYDVIVTVGTPARVAGKLPDNLARIVVGDVRRRGTRRWLWSCNLPDPALGRPILGREDSRREAVASLLAHVRDGKHPHLTQPPEGATDGDRQP